MKRARRRAFFALCVRRLNEFRRKNVNAMLVQETNHRPKSLFAMVDAMIGLSGRSASLEEQAGLLEHLSAAFVTGHETLSS